MGDLTASLLSKCPAKIRKSFKSFFMETLTRSDFFTICTEAL